MNSPFASSTPPHRPARWWQRWGAVALLGMFALGFFASLMGTGRLALRDFEVYYTACQRLFWADGPVYGEPFGLASGYYKYAPVAAVPFVPLAVLPLDTAQIVYYLLLTIGLAWGLPYVVRTVSRLVLGEDAAPMATTGTVALLLTLPLLMHFHRELLLGNVNWWLVLLLTAAINALAKGHNERAGGLMGFVLLVKPHFVVLLPLLMLRARWRTLSAVAATLSAGLLLPALWRGWAGNVHLLAQWQATMQGHNSTANLIAGPQTLFALVDKYILLGHDTAESWQLVAGGLALVAFSVLVYWLRHHCLERTPPTGFRLTTPHLAIEALLLVALVPNLTLTDTQHFMYATPLLAVLLVAWRTGKLAGCWAVQGMLVAALLLHGGNWHDLWGHNLSAWMEQRGFLGLGNVLICLVAVLALRPERWQQPKASSSNALINS